MALAKADRLDTAAESTVTEHGLVVRLGPCMSHTLHEVKLNASPLEAPHTSADVPAFMSGTCPDLLTAKTV